MPNIYFIDESGNTGDIATQQALTGFAEQPFFSLACIGIDNKKRIDNFAKELIKKHKIQANELKSTNICTRKRYIIQEVIEFLIDNKCKILVEIVNKRYQLCSSLMDYYLYCPYIMPTRDTQESIKYLKMIYDYIYKFIDDRCIEDFIRAFSSPDDDLTYIEKCIENMMNIVRNHANNLISFVQDVKDIFLNMKYQNKNTITKKKIFTTSRFFWREEIWNTSKCKLLNKYICQN